MSRNTAGLQFVHFNVTITLNEDSYYYQDPKAVQSFEFTIPTVMFNAKQFSELVQAQLAVLAPALDAEKLRIEAEEKAKEAVEKTE